MPYKRTYAKKKTYGRKRTYRRKSKGLYAIRKKVSYLLKNAVEKRIKDYAIVADVTNDWQWTSVVSMDLDGTSSATGDGYRSDQSIRALSLTLMGNINFGVDENSLGEGMRLCVILDTQFSTAGASTVDTPWQDNEWDSLIAAGTRGRYTILMDKVILNKNSQITFPIRYTCRINRSIRWNGANIYKNVVYVAYCGIQSGIGGSQYLDMKARLHYTT